MTIIIPQKKIYKTQKNLFRKLNTIASILARLITKNIFIILMLLFLLLEAGCKSAQLPSQPMSIPAEAPPELPDYLFISPEQSSLDDPTLDTIFSLLVMAEREASNQKDLPLLSQLWTQDARIIDGRGTKTSADDYRWEGNRAILDRYLVAVFPYPPPLFSTPPELIWNTQQADTGDNFEPLVILAENGHDRWTFIYQNERWWLHELVYSSPTD